MILTSQMGNSIILLNRLRRRFAIDNCYQKEVQNTIFKVWPKGGVREEIARKMCPIYEEYWISWIAAAENAQEWSQLPVNFVSFHVRVP